MIPIEKLRPRMILKYNANRHAENSIDLIVHSITPDGPSMNNYTDKYKYGILNSHEYFHKWNTTRDQIAIDVEKEINKPRRK